MEGPGWIERLRRSISGRVWPFRGLRRPASPGAYLARRQRRRLLGLLAAGTVLVLLVGGAFLHLRRAGRPSLPSDPSILVLPFANLGGDPSEDYFADGMTEEIQGSLSQIPGLRVIGRTTSFAMRGTTPDRAELRARLGVTAILEGSVRRSGNRLRVSAQLVDTRDGYQIWSRTFDRSAGDVLAVQDEIGQAVVEALLPTLAPGGRKDLPARPVDPEAYNQYLLARRFLAPSSQDGFLRATAASEKAISRSPRFAPAWATLAAAFGGLADYAGSPEEIASNQAKAIAAAARAVELDPGLAEGYAIRGQLIAQTTWNWEAAGDDFDRAVALAPGDADILRKRGAWLLAPQGRLPDAIHDLGRSTALDPLSVSSWTSLGFLQASVTQGLDGEPALLRALEIDPENDYVRQALGVRQLLRKDPAAALDQFRRCGPGMWRVRGTALAERDLGHPREADAALSELTSLYAIPSPFQIAEVHAWRGEADQAFVWLEKAFAARDGGLMLLPWDPLLARIRGDPRMEQLLRRMNVNPE